MHDSFHVSFRLQSEISNNLCMYETIYDLNQSHYHFFVRVLSCASLFPFFIKDTNMAHRFVMFTAFLAFPVAFLVGLYYNQLIPEGLRDAHHSSVRLYGVCYYVGYYMVCGYDYFTHVAIIRVENEQGWFAMLSSHGGCNLQVAGHCFTITKTAQTFTKMLTLGLNTIFRPNVSIREVFGCFSYGETVTCNSKLQPAVYTLQSSYLILMT